MHAEFPVSEMRYNRQITRPTRGTVVMRQVLLLASSLVLVLQASPQAPTFYKDVLPVLQRRCQSCHRPGEAVPMSLMTYESTRPWAAAIREAVRTKKMPPWGADASHGHFKNDPTLTPAELETLTAWVDAKAPAGNPKDAP